MSENKRLSTKIKYLEKEIKQREQMIKDLMDKPMQYPAYVSPDIQSK